MGFKKWIDGLIYGDKEDDLEYAGTGFEETNEDFDTPVSSSSSEKKENGKKDGRTTNVNMTSGSSIEMKVIKPEKLESVTQIADHLLDHKTILLNLEETNKETARRLIDFLNGVAYAINGNLKKVAVNTYVITPNNVEISGEQLHDAQERSDIF